MSRPKYKLFEKNRRVDPPEGHVFIEIWKSGPGWKWEIFRSGQQRYDRMRWTNISDCAAEGWCFFKNSAIIQAEKAATKAANNDGQHISYAYATSLEARNKFLEKELDKALAA